MEQLDGLGKAISLLREEHGLSQTDLARQFGMPRRVLNSWETGRNLPRLNTLGELLTWMGYDAADLLRALEAVNQRPRLHVRRLEVSQESARARIIEILGLQDLDTERLEIFFASLASIGGAMVTVEALRRVLPEVGDGP